MLIKVHNAETGEVIEREMTNEELSNFEVMKENDLAHEKLKSQMVAARAALLEKLGITEDEAKLLLS